MAKRFGQRAPKGGLAGAGAAAKGVHNDGQYTPTDIAAEARERRLCCSMTATPLPSSRFTMPRGLKNSSFRVTVTLTEWVSVRLQSDPQ